MTRVLSACVAVSLILVCLPGHALAQVNATLIGTVSDATSALIPGVEVTATNVNTGIVTTAVTSIRYRC